LKKSTLTLLISISTLVLLLSNSRQVEAQSQASTSAASSEEEVITHINLGTSLEKKGNNVDAIVEFEKAAKLKPDHPLVLINLGQAYQMAGKNAEALKEYKKYITLYPKGEHCQLISRMLQVMQSQVQNAQSSNIPASTENYLREALAPGGGRWESQQMPIKIFIANGEGIDGYKDAYKDILKSAIAEWCDATQGKVKVTYLDSADTATVKCRWTANPKELANSMEGGQAFVVKTTQGQILAADLLILTKLEGVSSEAADKYIRHVCLHEFGHVLGMPGHSGSPDDVMFSMMNPASAKEHLTDRDKKTALALYSIVVPANNNRIVVPVMIPAKPQSK
jgi:hypothetical protein